MEPFCLTNPMRFSTESAKVLDALHFPQVVFIMGENNATHSSLHNGCINSPTCLSEPHNVLTYPGVEFS